MRPNFQPHGRRNKRNSRRPRIWMVSVFQPMSSTMCKCPVGGLSILCCCGSSLCLDNLLDFVNKNKPFCMNCQSYYLRGKVESPSSYYVAETDETKNFETRLRLRLFESFIRDRDWDWDFGRPIFEIETETETLEGLFSRPRLRLWKVYFRDRDWDWDSVNSFKGVETETETLYFHESLEFFEKFT